MENKFTPQARKMWEQIPTRHKTRILNKVWCGNCAKATTILYLDGKLIHDELLLEGKCCRCGNDVARLIEFE